MTRDRFFEICQEERYPDAAGAWDCRPPWVEAALEEEVRRMIQAAVFCIESPEFQAWIEQTCEAIVAQEKASRN